MAVQILFDAAGVPLLPHLILATKSGRLIREIPVNEVRFRETLVSGSEFAFTVYKEACVDKNGDIDEAFWKKITDFKLAYCRDFDRWYELKADMTESTDIRKAITARSLGEAELSQINVYGIEVNTETDIDRDDYEPTVLYDGTHPERSLIDRLIYKAPHYRVDHVDESIQNIQRTFSFDGKAIYDCFGEVSQEINCLFVLDCKKKSAGGIDRTISVYDLEYHCPVCGLRGEFMPVCDNCGHETVPGYGTDTSVFVAKENLAQEITYTTNTDAVKNCFRLEAGDDLMTAAVIACNPNGSQYIWYITDEMKGDMTQALQNRLASYDALYEYYQTESTYQPPSDMRSSYNAVVAKYQSFREDLTPIPETITGYPALMNEYFNTIDLQMFLESELMPSVEISTTDAEREAAKLTSQSLSPVAVANLASVTETTAASAVVGMAKCLIRGTYQVKSIEGSISTSGQFTYWTGRLQVTNYGDEEDTAQTGSVTIVITNNQEQYIQQKIDRMINQTADDPTDISSLFKLSIAAFTAELPKYCRSRLIAFRAACQAALDILIQQGVADAPSWVSAENNLYQNMYVPYRNKMMAIEAEIRVREGEIHTVAGSYDDRGGLLTAGMQNLLDGQIKTIRSALEFEAYLGEELWTEFAGYRREDSFKNDNYISDGLNNYEMMINGQRFLNMARQEIYKSATLQHSIQASLSNLLAMTEFQPLRQKFRVGNWIRVRADGQIYRLRLSEYTVDYENWNLDVVFTDLKEGYNSVSDLQSMLEAVRSMQTTYGTVARQSKDGEDGKGLLDRWVNEGLALTTNIVGGAQNQEFVMDESGFTGKELIPETGEYSPEQVKIISHGVYMTDDGWVTAKAALGRFRFLNPQNNFQEEDAFGVIADKLVGNLILGQEVGIYNSNGSIQLDEDGFTLITEHTGNQKVFNIKRHKQDDTYEDLVYLDASGNLKLSAYSTTGEMETAISVSEEGIKTYVGDNYSTKTNTVADVDVEYISWDYPDDGQQAHVPPENDPHWTTESPGWEYGKYIWQRTKTVNGNGVAGYSSPTCIQGAAATVYSLEVSNTVIVGEEDGSFTPASVTFTGKSQNGDNAKVNYSGRFIIETTTDNSTWTTRYTSSANENAKTYTVPSGTLAVRCTLYRAGGTTTQLDTQVVPVISEGTTGEDAYTVILTNENHTFAGTYTGAVPSSTDCGVIAYKGATQVAATIGTITGAPYGMTTTITGNGTTSAKFTVAVTYEMVIQNGTLTIPITVDGKTFNMIFTYSLAMRGAEATSYSMIVSHAAVGKSQEGVYNPAAITLTGKSQTGSNSLVNYSGRFKIETTSDGSTWTTQYTSSSNENTKSYTVPDDITAIRCSLYKAGGTTTLLDQQTVPIVTDGTDGQPGENGEDAYTVILTNENHTFAGSETAAIASNTDCYVVAYKGATQVAATIGTITGVPTGMTVTPSGSGTTSAKFTVAVTTSMTTKNGTLSVPVTVDGKTFNMVFTYSLALKGDDGEPGVGVSDIAEQYYLSTSDQSPAGGSWSYTQPEWVSGKYIWTRSEITWDDSTQADPHITYTDPVLAQAINGANEQAYDTQQTLVRNYSTKTETKELISSEVGKTTIELVNGINESSTNMCPYPPTVLNDRGYYEITDNFDGSYDILKTSDYSYASFAIQFGDGTSEILSAGQYVFRVQENVTAANSTSVRVIYYDTNGTAHANTFPKSQSYNLYTYQIALTLATAATRVEFATVTDSAAKGYHRLWRIQINEGDTALPWDTPVGAAKLYATNNFCPWPMSSAYSAGTIAPVDSNVDGSFSGKVALSGTSDYFRLIKNSPQLPTDTYNIQVIEECVGDDFADGSVKFYNGSSETTMTAGEKEIIGTHTETGPITSSYNIVPYTMDINVPSNYGVGSAISNGDGSYSVHVYMNPDQGIQPWFRLEKTLTTPLPAGTYVFTLREENTYHDADITDIRLYYQRDGVSYLNADEMLATTDSSGKTTYTITEIFETDVNYIGFSAYMPSREADYGGTWWPQVDLAMPEDEWEPPVGATVPSPVTSSSNVAPYPMAGSISATDEALTFTNNMDGSYSFGIDLRTLANRSVYLTADLSTPLPEGIYTLVVYEDGDTNSYNSMTAYVDHGGSRSASTMYKHTDGNGNVYYSLKNYYTGNITRIQFQASYIGGYIYNCTWKVKINSHSSSIDWGTPAYRTETGIVTKSNNLCPYPLDVNVSRDPENVNVTANEDGSYTIRANLTHSQSLSLYIFLTKTFATSLAVGTYYFVLREKYVSGSAPYNQVIFYYKTESSGSSYAEYKYTIGSVDIDGRTNYICSITPNSAVTYVEFCTGNMAPGNYEFIWYPQFISGIIRDWEAPVGAKMQLCQWESPVGSTGQITENIYRHTYTTQSNIQKTASSIYFKKTGVPEGTYDFNWKIMINNGGSYKDWEIPSSIGTRYSISNAYSQINQTAESIELKVSKDGVISAINQSPEQITIDASKVNITGFLTVSDVGAEGTTEIWGGRIKGGTITLGGGNNGNGQVDVKNSNNVSIVTINNSGITVRNTSGTTIGSWGSGGISIYSGTIQGPTIYVGGSNNGNGALYVRNSNNTTIVTLNNTGIYTTNTTINASGISTTSLTASEYIYCNGSSTSCYLKIPMFASYGYSGYMELSSYGFTLKAQGYTVNYNYNGEFWLYKNSDYTEFYGGVVYTYSSGGSSTMSGGNVVCDYISTGELNVSGYKHRIVHTKDFGIRGLSAMESASPIFADMGSAVIDECGDAYIFLEDIFRETVETTVEYQVFLQKYGDGDCYVYERRPDYFIVKGTSGLQFGWEIHAKQRDYDQDRIEPYYEGQKQELKGMMHSDCDALAAQFIEEYYHEIETNEGSQT